MKLCKDCKHAIIPASAWPLGCTCDHPNSKHDLVFGLPTEMCGIERMLGRVCGPDAKLFEERTAPEPNPGAGAIVYVQPQENLKRSWIARLFGR